MSLRIVKRTLQGACLIVAVLPITERAAIGSLFHFTVNRTQSSLTSNSSVQAPVPGTLIGNWDAKNNPTGTQTRPGFTGGSGNVPIPTTITFVTSGQFQSHPAGAFAMDLNIADKIASIADLSLDLLNGTPATQNLTLNLLYQTFHTVQPSAIFPGGVVLPLPLGQANVTVFTLVQSGGPSFGSLMMTARNTYNFSIGLTADLTLQADALGQPIVLGPVPTPLLLNGSVMVSGNDAIVNLAFDFAANQTVPGPFPGGTIENFPLDVPTVIPPGFTAHLLFSGQLQSISATLNLAGAINAAGHGPILGDVNRDGKVDIDDIFLIIFHWGNCPPPPCAADVNQDNVVDELDLNIALANWS